MESQPQKGRLVDTLPSVRTRPMKVIVLGLNRTGTMSMFTALQKLGYHPCHGTRMWEDPNKFLGLWMEAMRAKYFGEGERWGKREFDVVLGDFDAIMDLPAACMVEELLAAYPDAKFILTHRPVDRWLASMNSTIIPVMNWPSWRLLRHLDSHFVKPWYEYKQIMLKGWGGNDFGDENLRKTFLEHSALVKRVVPREQLLVFEVKEGWGPLCAFLGKESPEWEFPNVNDKEAYVEIFRRARNWVILRVVAWWLSLLAPLWMSLLGVVYAWWVHG